MSSDKVRVAIQGREVVLTYEEARELSRELSRQIWPIAVAREEASLDAARREGRIWKSVVSHFGVHETEEFANRNEALGNMWGAEEAGVGAAVCLISPDGSTLEGDALFEAMDHLYDDEGNYRDA